ncbi:MAG: FG-GAP repeat protein [Myxococcales bacterium]|nr:FG-GAP repeat protein [Myxococcales bacterium]
MRLLALALATWPALAAAQAPASVRAIDWKNHTFQQGDQAIKLTNGEWSKTQEDDSFSESLSLVGVAYGDVNGDGVEDIVVGGPNYPQNGDPILGPGAGYIEVLSGADLSPIYEVFGASSYQYFGAVVAGLPDISEDGGGDVAVAEPYAFTPGPSGVVATGRVKIYTGPTGDLALSIDGESEGELFGVGVSRAGDVDEDGFEDLVIGAPYWGTAGSERIGRLAVYSARTGAKIYEVTGEAPFDGFTGGGLVGDLTGDGIPEFVAAATGHDGPGGEDAGRVYVYDLHHRPTLEPCADADGDGYAVRTEPGAEMHFPWYDAVCGYVDCDDADAAVHPFAAETPGDGVDQNCNGSFACGALPADAAGRPWAYGIPFAGIVVALAVWRRRLA